MKERIDILLVQKGFFASREKAKSALMAGLIYVNNQLCDKAGTAVDVDSEIYVKNDYCPYVGRGGMKLEKALSCFSLDLTDAVCIDIGASTGGFTDCMLQKGAKKVYSIDVGYGQLDYKLRIDPRVINMEKLNVRYLDPDTIPELADLITIDVSFISLNLVFPVAVRNLKENGKIICLIKPQFEAGREQVGKKGIVRDPLVHFQVLKKVAEYGYQVGIAPEMLTYSPITGAKGNIEYLMLTRRISKDTNELSDENYMKVIKEAHNKLIKGDNSHEEN